MGNSEPEKQYFLSMALDAEDNAFVDEYASLRKASRATAIRQLLHDHLPAMIRQLKRDRHDATRNPESLKAAV